MTLGDDSLQVHKAREIMILLVAVIIITWFGTNYPKLWDSARIFWSLGLTAIVGILAAFILKKGVGLDLNVPLADDNAPIRIPRIYLFVLAIIAFLATFFLISTTSYSLYPPKFQIVELGVQGEAILSGAAAIVEDFFFFSLIAGVMFTILHYLLKNPIIALVLVLFLVPGIFTIYHTLVYGFTDFVQTASVYVFGFESMIWLVVFRDLIYVHARHVANNIGILVFTQYSLSSFFIAMLSSMWVWGFIIVALGVVVIRSASGKR